MFVRFALIPVYDNLTFYHIPVDSLLGIKEEAGIRPASSFVLPSDDQCLKNGLRLPYDGDIYCGVNVVESTG